MDKKLADVDKKALQLISKTEDAIQEKTGEKVALVAYDSDKKK